MKVKFTFGGTYQLCLPDDPMHFYHIYFCEAENGLIDRIDDDGPLIPDGVYEMDDDRWRIADD